MSINNHLIKIALAVALSLLICGPVAAQSTESGSFKKDKEIEINFGVPVDEAWAQNTANFSHEKPDLTSSSHRISHLDARKTAAHSI
jgi:hypothetical protein